MRERDEVYSDVDLSELSDERLDALVDGAAVAEMELERGDVFAAPDGSDPRRVVGLRAGEVQTVDPFAPDAPRQSYHVLDVYGWWLCGDIVPVRIVSTVVPERAFPDDADARGYVAVPRRVLATLADVVNDWLSGYDPADRDPAVCDAVDAAYDVLGHDPAEAEYEDQEVRG